jgi:hypothetical protein
MKHLRRWAFNGFAAISLILFVVMVVLWIRSYFVLDGFAFAHNFGSAKGSVAGDAGFNRGVTQIIIYWRDDKIRATHTGVSLFHNPPNASRITYVGFYYRAIPWSMPHLPVAQLIFIPHWFVCTLCLAMPLLWLRLRLKTSTNGGITCSKCGYDLRATPDRCPECGMVPHKT